VTTVALDWVGKGFGVAKMTLGWLGKGFGDGENGSESGFRKGLGLARMASGRASKGFGVAKWLRAGFGQGVR